MEHPWPRVLRPWNARADHAAAGVAGLECHQQRGQRRATKYRVHGIAGDSAQTTASLLLAGAGLTAIRPRRPRQQLVLHQAHRCPRAQRALGASEPTPKHRNITRSSQILVAMTTADRTWANTNTAGSRTSCGTCETANSRKRSVVSLARRAYPGYAASARQGRAA